MRDQEPQMSKDFQPTVNVDNLMDEDSSDQSRKGTPNPWEIKRRRELIKEITGLADAIKGNKEVQ